MNQSDTEDSRMDLHVHSCYSDGTLSPKALVFLANGLKLSGISITDHDNVAAWADLKGQITPHISLIMGIELSVQTHDAHEIHLLGYMFDPEHPALVKELLLFQHQRERRAGEIISAVNRILARQGQRLIKDSLVLGRSGGSIGRPHIAREMMRLGIVNSMDSAFKRYLIPCDRPKSFFHADHAIDLIHRAGGMVSWAHPTTLSSSFVEIEKQTALLVHHGLDAIEGYHPSLTQLERGRITEIAGRYGLLVTGGSDYHGPGWLCEFGSSTVSSSLVPEMVNRAARYDTMLQSSTFL